MAKNFAFINTWQEKILNKLWPGKVTAIFKRKDKLPKILFGKKKTIGLRIPDHRLIKTLLKRLNCPLTGTSANISGKAASNKVGEIVKQFRTKRERPDMILNAGNLKFSFPSMVIDLTDKKIKIIRI